MRALPSRPHGRKLDSNNRADRRVQHISRYIASTGKSDFLGLQITVELWSFRLVSFVLFDD